MTDSATTAQQLAEEAKRLRGALCALYHKQGGEFSHRRMQKAIELIREHDAAIDALALLATQAGQQAARSETPAGWKLVPIEPTDAMIDATYHGQPLADIWHDMLAAAPTPPDAVERMPLTEEQIVDAV